MRHVSDIMIKNFKTIDPLDGVRKMQRFVIDKNIDFFPVVESDKLVGLLTYKELIGVHPNRIVADAMRNKVILIDHEASVWMAKELIDENSTDVLLVVDNEKLVGIVTKTILYAELGRHTDLLTGLYKSDYIYYNAKKLIENGKNTAIIFIDINNFGFIDKKYGHVQGDNMLKEVAFILRKNTPSDAYTCRFGGDEFVVLVPYCLDKTVKFTINLLNIISKNKFCDKIKVNASAGIAIYEKGYDEIDYDAKVYELINRASLASTKAKKEERLYYIANCLESNETHKIV